MAVIERATGFPGLNAWGGYDGLGAVSQPVCAGSWKSVQQALNSRLRTYGQRTISEDGQRCCGGKDGKVYGDTYNALSWWLGPTGVSSSPSTMLGAIAGRSDPMLVELPEPSKVAQIQAALRITEDGCLGPKTAEAISGRVSGWQKMGMIEVLARIQSPQSEGSVLPSGAFVPPAPTTASSPTQADPRKLADALRRLKAGTATTASTFSARTTAGRRPSAGSFFSVKNLLIGAGLLGGLWYFARKTRARV